MADDLLVRVLCALASFLLPLAVAWFFVSRAAYKSAVIVLLTDGQNTVGPEPMDAAQVAAKRGV